MSKAYFEHVIVVTEADIDELGHVNNAIYLRYIEAVARAHAEHCGLTLERFRRLGVLPVVRRHDITYHRPAGLHEALRVSTRIMKLGGPKALRHNEVRRKQDGELLAEAETTWVWLEPQDRRPRRVPETVKQAFGF